MIGPDAYKDFTWVSCDVDWNSFDQSNEGEKEHIMHTVFAISLQGAYQFIPFHVFQFSVCTSDLRYELTRKVIAYSMRMKS